MRNGYFLYQQILKGAWLIDKQQAQALLPLAFNVLSGDTSGAEAWRSEDISFNTSINMEEGLVKEDSIEAPRKQSAVINIIGALTQYSTWCSPGMDYYGQLIQQFDNDEEVDSIILYIDSPGGSAMGTEKLAKIIQNTSKPIVSVVGGMCCSAAYWLASSSDEILAETETTLFGSIGTMVSFMDFKEYFAKQGIKSVELYATKSTDKNKDFADAANGNPESLIQNFLDPINAVFHAHVSSNRELEEKAYTGKTYTYLSAKNAGLVDGIGGVKEAINVASQINNNRKIEADMKFLDKVKAAVGVEAPVETIAQSLEQTAQDYDNQVSQLTQERDTAQSRITELEGQLATANERITDLEKEPGASPAATAPPRESSSSKEEEFTFEFNPNADEIL
ncbi:S49 family peptidase [Flammeovirga pacifica]|uniref:Peptidase S49 domain-containing protein n=1 Tax=Flammeovirga pacifica TaxID=915059 RepID=A0A1S1Z298_FLAPC|nr:S49 family peptidase [Flammeovirga pacifica]OHX67362.1 hypothetical protein NH26_13925 [Flammeovirga pacifica]